MTRPFSEFDAATLAQQPAPEHPAPEQPAPEHPAPEQSARMQRAEGELPAALREGEAFVQGGRVMFRDTTAEALYGELSVAVPPPALRSPEYAPVRESAVFQSMVLALTAAYLLLVCRHWAELRQTIALAFAPRDFMTGERMVDGSGRNGLDNFLNLTVTMGLFSTGAAFAKGVDWWMASAPEAWSHPHAVVMLLLGAAIAGTGAILLFQWLVLHLCGAVTLSQPFVNKLLLLKRLYFSLATLTATPALLLFALCAHGSGRLWLAVAAAACCVALLLYLKETLRLFLAEKVSLLHWILYLCSVEIFPVSFLALLAAG